MYPYNIYIYCVKLPKKKKKIKIIFITLIIKKYPINEENKID